ncbi:unnamed protein product [Clonostachys byssicola]|uniref:Uncharacterized protein n=1 Tax=Clonostachys byssicola TaxID=160290 RepID=A0A9N9UJ49_9HYPO|nr:unnamed protein product [Clonostachys byssicola]
MGRQAVRSWPTDMQAKVRTTFRGEIGWMMLDNEDKEVEVPPEQPANLHSDLSQSTPASAGVCVEKEPKPPHESSSHGIAPGCHLLLENTL